MVEPCRTIISRKSPLFIWFYVFEEECRSSWKPLPERPSLLRLSQVIPLKMLKQKSKTRRESHQISSDWSLQESNSRYFLFFLIKIHSIIYNIFFCFFNRMVEPCRTIISRKSPLFTWSFVFVEECRSSWKPLPERPSLLRLSQVIQLKMLKLKFKIRKEFHQISSDWSL